MMAKDQERDYPNMGHVEHERCKHNHLTHIHNSISDYSLDSCNHDHSRHGHGTCNHCNNHRSCITLVPIFNHLEGEQLDEIVGSIKSAHYKKGETIYRAGDESDSLYIVSSGKIRIYRLSESGKEQLQRILLPGDFTGELALFRQSVHESYGEAMMDTDICMITRDDLRKFLLKYPSISIHIMEEFSNRLGASERQAARVATERVETRIALYLVDCLEDQGGSMDITLPMTRKDLASYLGTTPETISRKLTDLEDMGYIQQKSGKKIRILDFEGLMIV